MTSPEVVQALNGFERRLRALGAPVVEHLRPGLLPWEMDRISAELEVPLPEEARAWWGWHDGDREHVDDDEGRPSLVPATMFCGLRSALEQSRRLHRPPDPSAAGAVLPGPFVALLQGERPLVMDCRRPGATDAPVGHHDAGRGVRGLSTFAEQIGWWCWALDNRYWNLHPDGTWGCDPERAPGRLIGPHVEDHF